jgi:hypothetical protein
MRKYIAAGVVVLGLAAWQASAGGLFDRLNDPDRAVLQARFEKELWPLLQRGGKDGCVGCHRPGQVTALKFSGEVGKDFRMLVKEGFFLPNDPGSLHSRIIDKDAKRRMPPGKRIGWTAQEAELLQAFIVDLDRKQQK